MSLRRRLLVAAAATLAALALLAVGSGIWVRSRATASLPRLDGEAPVPGLAAPARVDRDARGVPSIEAGDRLDLARALGFLHAQERWFQMDLLRRSAAGELSALFGPVAVDADRRVRVHRFRELARQRVADAAPAERELLEAYVLGVAAGYDALGAPPPEYLLLRVEPEPWRAEDTLLTLYAMYLDLQGGRGTRESWRGLVHDTLSPRLAAFLLPADGGWSAPLAGGPFPEPPLPGPDDVDWSHAEASPPRGALAPGDVAPGSNAWAVAGSHTADGGALLANDMHLGLGLPNVWYRVAYETPRGRGVGVTLPGAPLLVAGSASRVAWGFSNAYGDFADLVVIEPDPGDPGRYMTPDGPRPFDVHPQTIEVRGEAPVIDEVRWTMWGPVVDTDHRGRERALRWVAHDPLGANLGLERFAAAASVDDVVAAAADAGMPAQNVVTVDADGRIAWTVAGPIPRRTGFDGSIPTSWADGTRGWSGWVRSDDRPRVVDPVSGRIWTGNARVGDAAAYAVLGDEGAPLGARARQIRDGLLALDAATAADMLALQLDDRALFLSRWRDLALELLDDDAVADDERRREFRDVVRDGWTGRASIDSAGYRLVRAFRLFAAEVVLEPLAAPCREADPEFRVTRFRRIEGPLWRLIGERPAHLLSPEFASWRDALLAAVDRAIAALAADDGPLAGRTWGERNTVAVRHPLGAAVPALSRWFDTPPRQLPGDTHMPRVQSPGFGASERLVVSPGREADGLFHMPGGQSGHPLSPYYTTGIEAWAAGEPTPLLPGPATHSLALLPAATTPG